MHRITGTTLGKLVRVSTKVKGSGGQALPGLIVEKVVPSYLRKMLARLPLGVVVITGTNGKTTTTKIVVELLENHGLKVLTNRTGSNMTRGIASGVIESAKLSGKLKYDIAVFELDEASIVSFVKQIKPKYVLALNVSRDQLDRYGEVDKIAELIGVALKSAEKISIVNADDPNLVKNSPPSKTKYFSINKSLRQYFPTDYELAAVGSKSSPELSISSDKIIAELVNFKKQRATIKVGGVAYSSEFKLSGQHNYLNATAAVALVSQIIASPNIEKLVEMASKVNIAFGRGEKYKIGTREVELVLVKNPASFRQALLSYASGSEDLVIAINDNVADSRDVSWLWDVDFSSLVGRSVKLTSGSRAADMALRLQYENIKVEQIEPDFDKLLGKIPTMNRNIVILATYTAMLRLYAELKRLADK